MGTHGSLTKAGKVRSLTPKIDPIPHPPISPRKRNRINYYKRIVLGRPPGQPKLGMLNK
ncbi:MAG: 30S ribosomal protein S30e [Candidatus Geothermarchaeota archaeon]